MNEKAIIKIEAELDKSKKTYDFYMFCDALKTKAIPSQQMRGFLEKSIKDVKLEKAFSMRGSQISYSLEEPERYRKTKKNTVIEISIPFCLALPQNFSCQLNIKERNIKPYVIFRKIWTSKSKSSSSADFFTEDMVTFFAKSEITTPSIPQAEEDGWEHLFEGKNVARVNDNAGYFRYTRLFIEIDTNYSKEKLKNNEKYIRKTHEELTDICFEIVNRIIDVYRFTTNENYMEHLSSLNITNLYFVEHNLGFHGLLMGGGIESATMNRSQKEMNKIKKMLKESDPCPIHELFLLNAESSFIKRTYTLSLIESFQGLEIFLENFLISKYTEKGLNENETKAKLKKVWNLKDRLKNLLPEVGIENPNTEQNFWNKWCTMYDKDRNEVIHKGKAINSNVARAAVNLNKKMIDWIKNN